LDKLHDIKPIADISLPYIPILILVAILIAIIAYIFKKPAPSYSFDLTNPKQTAYQLIKILQKMPHDTQIDTYINKLHHYTYKKHVEPMDEKLFEEIIRKYNIKIHSLNK